MSRICLVGVGCPSFIASTRHLGPGLRAGHFATALARAGHDLLFVGVSVGGGDGHGSTPASVVPFAVELEGRRVQCVTVDEAMLAGSELAALVARFAPQAAVGATAYGAALAARLAPQVPLWADVFGDLMAEAQAKALAHGSDLSVVRFWTTLRVVLERGDRFSAVSSAQASALVGQLGLAGRLSAATAGHDLVSVIPCAAEPGRPRDAGARLRGTVVPEDAFVVLWSGSFNTWCDVETLVAGLELAMAERATIHFVATGGGVAGHDERTVDRFADLVARSPARERFHLEGWIRDDMLATYYREADVGVCIERDLYERRLGSENRVVQWLVHGLPALTTGLSELGDRLVGQGACFATPVGDARALAATLASLVDDPERVRLAGDRCRSLAPCHAYDATAAALVNWAGDPRRAADSDGRRPLTIGLLSSPGEMVELLEAYLAELSVGQIGYRSARWLWRRLRSSGAAAVVTPPGPD